MEKEILEVGKLIEGIKTYPSWTTDSSYELKFEGIDGEKIRVFYTISGPVKRKISREFPKNIELTKRFLWALGFLKGEGSNSLGKSNYRRFTITNTNPDFLNIVLEELEKKNLFKKDNIINGGVNIVHAKQKEEVVRQFWSEKLNLPLEKIRYYDDNAKTSEYGVCHIYISDVLLRRVLDEINLHIMKEKGQAISCPA